MIDLDRDATTPVLSDVFEAMRPARSPMKPGPAARQGIRLSLGPENTAAEIGEATAAVRRCASMLGGMR